MSIEESLSLTLTYVVLLFQNWEFYWYSSSFLVPLFLFFMVPALFLHVNVSCLSFFSPLRVFVASCCLSERQKGDLTEKLTFTSSHQVSQWPACQFAITFIFFTCVRHYSLWKQFHRRIYQIVSYFQLISSFKKCILVMKVIKTWQQLAWWCTVAAACQGGHYCSTVPYAFFLLSKIGCLKL